MSTFWNNFFTMCHLPFGKLPWQWKTTIFNRRYFFKWWISHCYVRLPECTFLQCYVQHLETNPPKSTLACNLSKKLLWQRQNLPRQGRKTPACREGQPCCKALQSSWKKTLWIRLGSLVSSNKRNQKNHLLRDIPTTTKNHLPCLSSKKIRPLFLVPLALRQVPWKLQDPLRSPIQTKCPCFELHSASCLEWWKIKKICCL